MKKLLGGVLFLALFVVPVGCASPYQQHLMRRHVEATDFALDAARENQCLSREGNKAVVASSQAVAFGGTPKDYANPKHLSGCEYLGR